MNNSEVHIIIPNSFAEERTYLLRVIFGEFLNISYDVEKSDKQAGNYEIYIRGKRIEIEDHFFNLCNESKGYLISNMIPGNVCYTSNQFIRKKDVIILFGNEDIRVGEDGITCGVDIFASIFYMLTRWEECAIVDRDYLDRFPASSSLAFKFNFLDRPVVNEWVEMLKNMIRHFDPSVKFNPQQKFEIIFTHDIDLLNSPATLREFAKDIIRRKSPSAVITRAKYLLKSFNPYDTFDYFMDVSERLNTRSRFYFMTGHNITGKDGEPYNKTKFYKYILDHINRRGHVIGFHPSLLSYNNPGMFKKEKEILEKDIKASVFEGRQHALRFSIPDTWKMWEDCGMKMDSTMGYSAMEGFRCGTGYNFTVFDVKRRKHLKLKELPLIVMDTTLNVNRKQTIKQSSEIITKYIGIAREYDMPVTLLFHNLINDSIDWNGWKGLYDDLFVNRALV